MNIEKLISLSKTDFTNFISSENNVKYNIVIPFLQSFNHSDLQLEHAAQGSRIDINIGNRIIVETKALGQNINMHVQQLSDYSGKELPVLAILTNGKHFRIYSPQWRHLRNFSEKIIYEFELIDLSNIQLLTRLDKILDFSNYESQEFIDHIEKREREILQVKKDIENIKKLKSVQLVELQNEINGLKEQVQEIVDQIESKEQIVKDINSDNIPEINSRLKETFFPINRTPININSGIAQIPKTAVLINNTESVGSAFKIENTNKDVLAFGRILSNGNFLVLKGSSISNKTAEKFQSSAPSAYKRRKQLLNDGTINSQRKFTKDVEFNSKSGAASVVLGDSSNGNKDWKPNL